MDSQPEEFHDFNQNVDNIQESQLSQLQLLLIVDQPEGQTLPPTIYTPDVKAAMCVRVVGQSPVHMRILNIMRHP